VDFWPWSKREGELGKAAHLRPRGRRFGVVALGCGGCLLDAIPRTFPDFGEPRGDVDNPFTFLPLARIFRVEGGDLEIVFSRELGCKVNGEPWGTLGSSET